LKSDERSKVISEVLKKKKKKRKEKKRKGLLDLKIKLMRSTLSPTLLILPVNVFPSASSAVAPKQ
jgi:hypothetical protein